MSRPVTRSQRSVGSVGANSGNLGRGQVVGSGPHNREAYQVIEEETDSHEVVGAYFNPDLAGPSSFVRNLERATMASQVPLGGGLGGQGGGLRGPPQGAPGGGVGGQGGQRPGTW